MFTNERTPALRTVPVTLEQQLQNLVDMRKRKEGQIRSLKWMARVVQNQLDREFRELETIREAIEEMA